MEKRLAYFLTVVGWWFVVVGALLFCGAAWNIAFDGQAGIGGNLIEAASAAFGLITGLLFVLRSRKVLMAET